MALLSIQVQGDWYIYIWVIYCKIYSAIIWLIGNHCRGVDKSGSVITAGVGGQSPASLHRVRTRRRKPQQQHRAKHIVALARRPSLRRIVMAPGASTAHTMMEDKEKVFNGPLPSGESSLFAIPFYLLVFSWQASKYVIRIVGHCNQWLVWNIACSLRTTSHFLLFYFEVSSEIWYEFKICHWPGSRVFQKIAKCPEVVKFVWNLCGAHCLFAVVVPRSRCVFATEDSIMTQDVVK